MDRARQSCDSARSLVDLGALHDEGLVDVGDDTAASDGGLDQGVELLVAADGELQVAGSDALDLEVLRGVARELKHLGSEVLEDGSRVDRGSGADARAGVDSALQEPVDPANRELTGLALAGREDARKRHLPEVRREPNATGGSSWTCRFRTCLLCLLFHLCRSAGIRMRSESRARIKFNGQLSLPVAASPPGSRRLARP